MRPSVSYIPCGTSSKGKNGDKITLAQFLEEKLLSETCEEEERDDESRDESYDDPVMPPLLSLE